jgi:hypothetical protein
VVVHVLGQGLRECNDLTSLATRENTEGDLIKQRRHAWTLDWDDP